MEGNIYAVIDTNVIVSALISKQPDTAPLIVLKHLFSGIIIPIYNDEIIQEYRDVLSRDKFHLSQLDIEEALKVITVYGLKLERTTTAEESFPDPKDIVFYEVKMSKEDAYLVTGNTRHFPKNTLVVTPREMVEILSASSR